MRNRRSTDQMVTVRIREGCRDQLDDAPAVRVPKQVAGPEVGGADGMHRVERHLVERAVCKVVVRTETTYPNGVGLGGRVISLPGTTASRIHRSGGDNARAP